ncbi:MAG: BON domain-containing protein [Beijerinckiaceae bacterium]|nr:BON domain-containing protein [Beijerinckiaceae bacterium]
MRSGESGSYGGYMGGTRYGSGSHGGRSGMGFGGSSGSRSSGWGSRELGQYSGMTSEPGYGAGYRSGSGSGMSRGGEQGYGYGGPHDWSGQRGHDDERGFWDKASDEVSSWFGDEDAERRREMDRRHSGRGPRNYARSDSRINEDVCDRLTDHPMVDASEIEVSVSEREVTLTGTVNSRDEKRRAEDIAEAVSGVTHVQNNLRVKQQGAQAGSSTQRTLDSFSHATEGAFGEHGGSTMSSRTTSASSGASGGSARTGSTTSASGSNDAKTTTGGSPGVMRSDPSTSTTRSA